VDTPEELPVIAAPGFVEYAIPNIPVPPAIPVPPDNMSAAQTIAWYLGLSEEEQAAYIAHAL
jgi:hypothetical protein